MLILREGSVESGIPLVRPVVKAEHRPYRTPEGNVRIGSVVHGIGAEISDPDSWIWDLLCSLDGQRPPERIAEEMARSGRGPSASDVLQAVRELYDAGFLEDAAAEVPDRFTAQDRERYSRGVPLLRWMDRGPNRTAWTHQLSLAQSRVLLVGLGGAGGMAAQCLVASGVGQLHCVDPDTVELSNLNRQLLYREPDVGAAKAERALASLRALNTRVRVTAEQSEVTGTASLLRLLRSEAPGGGSYDLLVLCADRPADIRRWANEACLLTGTAWVEGGYRGPCVTVGVYRPGDGSCWECHRASDTETKELGLPAGADPDLVSPRMDWSPANAVTANLAGTLIAHGAISLLTGVPGTEPGYRFGVNLVLPGDPVWERYPRRADCPDCSGAPPAARP